MNQVGDDASGSVGFEERGGTADKQQAVETGVRKQRIFKIIVIGDSNVGKTCLTYRFCEGKFPDKTEATIGVDFREKNLTIGDDTIKVSLVLLRRNIPPETQQKLLLRWKIFFSMSLVTKLTLTLTVNDENNESVSRSWIVFSHGIVANLTSAVENPAAEYLAFKRARSININLILCPFEIRVARCPVFNRTVRYFGSLSGIKMSGNTGTTSVRYFGESYLATLFEILLRDAPGPSVVEKVSLQRLVKEFLLGSRHVDLCLFEDNVEISDLSAHSSQLSDDAYTDRTQLVGR